MKPQEDNELKFPRIPYVVKLFIKNIRFKKEIHENLTRPSVNDFNISEQDEIKLAMDHVNSINKIIKMYGKKKVTVIPYIHPYQYTIFNDKYSHLGRTGKTVFKSELNALDLEEYLKENSAGDPLFIDGSHLTSKGHKVYCSYFSNQIKNELKIKSF